VVDLFGSAGDDNVHTKIVIHWEHRRKMY
jgi:hypothetical protein